MHCTVVQAESAMRGGRVDHIPKHSRSETLKSRQEVPAVHAIQIISVASTNVMMVQ